MAQGLINRIGANERNITIYATVDSVDYTITLDRLQFNLLTGPGQRSFIVNELAIVRRADVALRNAYISLIGLAITVPD